MPFVALRGWRLRPKLVASYVLLGLWTTLVTLGGGRIIYRGAEAHEVWRVGLMARTSEIVGLANSSGNEASSYLVLGDPAERDQSLARLDDAVSRMRLVAADPELSPGDKTLADGVVAALEKQQAAATALLDDYARTTKVARPLFVDYEHAVDARMESLSHFRNVAWGQNAGDRSEMKSERLIVLVGLVAMLLSILIGLRLARYIADPVVELRDAATALGAGRRPSAPLALRSHDEIGELARAFEAMSHDMNAHGDEARRGRELLEDVYASVPEALVVCDREGRIVIANPGCCRMSGYEASSLTGQPSSFLFLDFVIESDEDEATRELEIRMRTATGEPVPVRVSVSRLRGRNQGGWVCVAQNLTEHHRLELELRQAQKMDAIGRLAGGVAHDFNNLLQVIVGNSETLMEDLKQQDPNREVVSEIIEAGSRAAELTRQLLAFSRKQVLNPQLHDLNDIVSDAEKMLQRLLGSQVQLATTMAATDARVKVDRGQIEQVILNLVVNARDAMAEGGTVTLETREVQIEHADPSFPGVHPGDYLMLAVTDNGVGMDRATLARIFEPFFTTKAIGKGTGLGLSTVFGIVEQSGGRISVQSAPGRGTRFQILFPMAEPSVRISVADSVRDPGMSAGVGTVLVVDDEDAVRRLAARVLRRRGYIVLEATNAGEALLICEQHRLAIDLVLTDMVMPHMNGRRLVERLHRMRPSMEVIYMSGYPDDSNLDVGKAARGRRFIQKPFTPAALSKLVREVLDREQALSPSA